MYYLLITVILTLNTNISQSKKTVEGNHFFQSIFIDLETREQAVELNQKVYSLDGILVSRCDIVSKKFFCVFDPNRISSTTIETAVNNWGFHLRESCSQEGVQGVDKVTNLLNTCQDE